MIKPKLAWSFSALDVFETCPKKYYHLKVIKDVKDSDNAAALDGKVVHDALFKRVCEGVPLPLPLRHYEDIAARFADTPGEKHGEMKLALNEMFEPRAFFDKDVWVRAIIDLLIVRDKTAILIDWKTGKKKDRFDQLQLAAAVLSRYMPEIDEFKLVFAWLKDRDFSTQVLLKADVKKVWLNYLPRVKRISNAIDTTNFQANPGPLCGWCPVAKCPHWIDRSRDR